MPDDGKNDLLTAALEYVARGWPVFPIRERAKVPLIPTGFKAATLDPKVVEAWWGRWPKANIGIPTGEVFVVVDIDVGKGGEESLEDLVAKHGAVPDTVESLTGGGGRHLLFQPPEDGKFKNSAGLLGRGLDTRGQGGYIVAPPSVHESGREYAWELSSSPENTRLAALPSWLNPSLRGAKLEFDATGRPHAATGAPASPGERNVTAASLAGTYLREGMSIGEILTAVKDWNGKNPEPLPEAEVERTVASVARTHLANNPTAEVPLVALEEPEPSPAPREEKPVFPRHLLSPPGYLGDLCEWLNTTAYLPQPVLSLANALAFWGAVTGRKVATPTDLRTNVYCLGVGEAGCGKDHSRKQIKRLCHAAGLTDSMLGGEEVSSDSAILNAVSGKLSVLFQFDEIGHMIAVSTAKYAAHYLRGIPILLTKLYSSAQTTYLGREYADSKANPRKDLIQPNACVYGTTVPRRFYGAISPDEIRDGFLGRMLVFHSDNPDPESNRKAAENLEVPDSLVLNAQAWWTRDDLPKAQGNIGAITENIPMLVPIQEEAQKLLDKFEAESRKQRKKERLSDFDTGFEALWSRAPEHAQKLALLYACGCSFQTPAINLEAMSWGCELAHHLVLALIYSVRGSVSDTDHGRQVLQIRGIIDAAGEQGMSLRDITRRTQSVDQRTRKGILEQLLETELVYRKEHKPLRGRPTIRYYGTE